MPCAPGKIKDRKAAGEANPPHRPLKAMNRGEAAPLPLRFFHDPGKRERFSGKKENPYGRKNVRLNIPVIALRGLTVFPDLTLSFDVEREISIYALDSAMEGDRTDLSGDPAGDRHRGSHGGGSLYGGHGLPHSADPQNLGDQRAGDRGGSVSGPVSTACGRISPFCRPTWSCWRRTSPAA